MSMTIEQRIQHLEDRAALKQLVDNLPTTKTSTIKSYCSPKMRLWKPILVTPCLRQCRAAKKSARCFPLS